jgi:hypothetical protein
MVNVDWSYALPEVMLLNAEVATRESRRINSPKDGTSKPKTFDFQNAVYLVSFRSIASIVRIGSVSLTLSLVAGEILGTEDGISIDACGEIIPWLFSCLRNHTHLPNDLDI